MKNDLTGMLRAAPIAALAAVLAAAAAPAFAASGAAPTVTASAHAHAGIGHVGHVLARSRGLRNAGWGLWGYGPAVYGVPQSAGVEPAASVGALSERVTYTYDVPWDAVHRYPPAVRPYEYAQGCHTQHETVPKSGGGKQSVDIIRCY